MLKDTTSIIKSFKDKGSYISDEVIATAVLLASKLEKPLLIEGEAGVGKTELAKVIAKITSRELIRLQCYEGIDESAILYEWAYAKQLLYAEVLRSKINTFLSDTISLKDAIKKIDQNENAFFTYEFLQARPLLKALLSEKPVVLLIDEIDRSDRETEAFLLEALSDFQVSIPEIGTIKAENKPFVVLTSNSTRELSDALKRRCIYLYIDLPTPQQELKILKIKIPSLKDTFANEIIKFIQKLRSHDWKKIPSIAESIDWVMALISLNFDTLTQDAVFTTINLLLKHKSDLKKSTSIITSLFNKKRKTGGS